MPGTPLLSRSTKQERSGRDAPFWMPWLLQLKFQEKEINLGAFRKSRNFFLNFLAPLFLS